MVNFKNLADKAKEPVDKRGGTDSLKADAERAEGHRQGTGQPHRQGEGSRRSDQGPGAERRGRDRRRPSQAQGETADRPRRPAMREDAEAGQRARPRPTPPRRPAARPTTAQARGGRRRQVGRRRRRPEWPRFANRSRSTPRRRRSGTWRWTPTASASGSSAHQSTHGAPATASSTRATRFARSSAWAASPSKVHWTLTRSDPPELAEWDADGPKGAGAKVRYRFEHANGGTRFGYENDFDLPKGPVKLIAGKVAGAPARRAARKSLGNLKRLAESEAS